jgi:hypothetical protein
MRKNTGTPSSRGAGFAREPGIQEHGREKSIAWPVFTGSGPAPDGASRNDTRVFQHPASAQIHSDDTVQRVRPRRPVGLQPTDLFRGESLDPFLPWAPAFAGVTTFFAANIGPPTLGNLLSVSEHQRSDPEETKLPPRCAPLPSVKGDAAVKLPHSHSMLWSVALDLWRARPGGDGCL